MLLSKYLWSSLYYYGLLGLEILVWSNFLMSLTLGFCIIILFVLCHGVAVSHMQDHRAQTSTEAVIVSGCLCLWCHWTAVTTSKLLPRHHLAVLGSEICPENRFKDTVSKPQWATFHLQAVKWIVSSHPKNVSLTLMSCLPWNGNSPKAKITDAPSSRHGRRRHRWQNWGKGGHSSAGVWCVIE